MSLSFSKNSVTAFFVGLFLLVVSSSVSGQQVFAPTGTTGGPGTEMTQIINRLGLGSDCGRCKALAAEMDQNGCLLYTSPSPRDRTRSRMPSSA